MAHSKTFISIFFLATLLATTTASASTESQYWGYWDRSNERNRDVIDHRSWDNILGNYVVDKKGGANRFRYGALSSADKKALKNYISALEKIDPRSYSRNEQQAYWLNLYNAITVKIISDNYPVKTFTEIRARNLSTARQKADRRIPARTAAPRGAPPEPQPAASRTDRSAGAGAC